MTKLWRNIPDFEKLPSSLVEVISKRAELTPDRTALVFLADGEKEEIPITYKGMDFQSRAIAGRLQKFTKRGDRVLLIYPPGIEFLTAFFGCQYAGVIAVPVYPPRKDKDIARVLTIVRNASTSAVLTNEAILQRLEKTRANYPAPELEQMEWIPTDAIADMEILAADWQNLNLEHDDVSFLQYTSGSTGTPKGVMVSHGNLIHNQLMLTNAVEHTQETLMVSWLPLYHDMGLIGNIMHPLFIGHPCVFMSPEGFLQKPFRWLNAISRFQATSTGGAPNFAFDLCSDRVTPEQKEQLDLSSWTFALIGADTVRRSTIERFTESFSDCGFRKETFYPAYGLAEATLHVASGFVKDLPKYLVIDNEALKSHRVEVVPDDHENAQTLVACGRTWIDQKIKIVNPDTHTECAANEVGEIWITGPNVSQGYWGNEEATQTLLKAKINNQGDENYLRTGDLGFILDDELYITGRIKNLIVIRGRNHYPQDIEFTIESEIDGLRSGCSAAFSVEQNDEEKLVIVAELERRIITDRRKKASAKTDRPKKDRRTNLEQNEPVTLQNKTPELEDIIQGIRQLVAESHGLQVHSIALVKPVSIPKTTSGKLRRIECRDQYLNNQLVILKQWADEEERVEQISKEHLPVSIEEIHDWLRTRLSKELKLPSHQIDPKVELFHYGLDSLTAVTITGELEDWIGRPVSPTVFYNYPTIESIAIYISGIEDPSKPIKAQVTNRHQLSTAIAVVGAACRFPGANSLQAFWELLINQTDAISEIPSDRWNSEQFYDEKKGVKGKMNTRWGGFLDGLDQFDPMFFGISPREAINMDPQQRLLLEVSWEALENAGIDPHSLSGSKTGVYIGISNNEYSRLMLANQDLNAYQGTGSALSIAANRISYQYDLQGPSLAIDTACSSSLVAVHHACHSLRNGESTMAIAGGVNVILTPEPTVVFSQADMMAADGRCKTFDEKADGYVRAEGCGLVVLKLVPDAIADGDEILAVIRGSAVNQDGRSNGITAPSGLSQEAVITQALLNADVQPSKISYVEAHGTGTALGDPIEVESLKTVVTKNRTLDQKCFIGSVKTNLGHLESAAGIAGLIKTVLSIHRDKIPANLHFEKLNPLINLDDTGLSIPTSNQSWPAGSKQKLAGVSSFGFGGTNAHVIIDRFHHDEIQSNGTVAQHLFTLSAKTEEALKDLAEAYIRQLDALENEKAIANLCYSTNRGRTHFNNRISIITDSADSLKQNLQLFLKEPSQYQNYRSLNEEDGALIVFNFPSQNTFADTFAHQILVNQPTFARSIEWSDQYLKELAGIPLIEILSNPKELLQKHPEWQLPAVFAVEYALAELWRSWGLKPDAVMGNGIGRLVVCCVAGILDLEMGLKLSADATKLDEFLAEATLGQPNLSIIFDSEEYYEFKQRDLMKYLNGIQSKTGSSPEEDASRHQIYRYHLLMGPGKLTNVTSSEKNDPSPVVLPSLLNGSEDWIQLLQSLQTLYMDGVKLDWKGIYRNNTDLKLIQLPHYPFQRKSYWLSKKITHDPASSIHNEDIYQVYWKESFFKPNLEQLEAFTKLKGFWLILADKNGVAEELAKRISKNEGQAVLIYSADELEQKTDSIWSANPAEKAHLTKVLIESTGKYGECLGIVHLWNLDANFRLFPSIETLNKAVEAGCEGLLNLSHALLENNIQVNRGVWLVSEQAQLIDSEPDTDIAFQNWPMWGFAKGFAMEHPEFKVKLVDVDEKANETNGEVLFNEITQTEGEWQIAFRSSKRYVARLGMPKTPQVQGQTFSWKPEATYVITGGLGELGLKVAEYLVNKGIRSIALLSRRKFSMDSVEGTEDMKYAQKMIKSLQANDASIEVFQTDVTDFTQLENTLHHIQQSMAPIRGIIHAAGVVSRAALSELTTEELNRILKPKIAGTWNLHELCRSIKLDCFILFSSISAVWGSKSLSHYAAANAFLDGFAQYRRSLGLPALSVNWGPWIGGGMTTKQEQKQMERMGVFALNAKDALDAMSSLLNQKAAQGIVASMKWPKLHRLYDTIGYGHLFENLVETDDEAAQIPTSDENIQETRGIWLSKISSSNPAEQFNQLLGLIKEEIAIVLQCQTSDIDAKTGFFDLGMDSLMAVELKEKIQQSLSISLESTMVFDYPNLEALTRFLLDRIDSSPQPQESPKLKQEIKIKKTEEVEISKPSTLEAESKNKDLDDLTEDEIAKLIDQELDDL